MVRTEVLFGVSKDGLRWRLLAWPGRRPGHLMTLIEFTLPDKEVASAGFGGTPTRESNPITTWIGAPEGCPNFLIVRAGRHVSTVYAERADDTIVPIRLSEYHEGFGARFGALELEIGAHIVGISAEMHDSNRAVAGGMG
jgi:hypothetical protein